MSRMVSNLWLFFIVVAVVVFVDYNIPQVKDCMDPLFYTKVPEDAGACVESAVQEACDSTRQDSNVSSSPTDLAKSVEDQIFGG